MADVTAHARVTAMAVAAAAVETVAKAVVRARTVRKTGASARKDAAKAALRSAAAVADAGAVADAVANATEMQNARAVHSERLDAEGKPQEANAIGVDAGQERGPRPERGERNGRQGNGRAERNEGTESRNGAETPQDANPDNLANGNLNGSRSEFQGEAREGRGRGRNGRRNDRGPRADTSGAAAEDQLAQTGLTAQDTLEEQTTPADSGVRGERDGEPREKRSRDRYGRDRGPRAERTGRTDEANTDAPQPQSYFTRPAAPQEVPEAMFEVTPIASHTAAGDTQAAATQQVPAVAPAAEAVPAATPAVATVATTVATTVVTPVVAPAIARAAAATSGMPQVTAYALPLETLQQVAAGSGLQWVNSDPQRIAAVQAAIAAEPKPLHVPRERPAPVVMDEGPLILVETKRDLRNLQLPFEQDAAA